MIMSEGEVILPITLQDKMKDLTPAQRRRVKARAAELMAEEIGRRGFAIRSRTDKRMERESEAPPAGRARTSGGRSK